MKLQFPKMPDVMAKWAPIYMEPIMESGEKITIGIVAVPQNGEDAVVMPVLNHSQVTCAFGDGGLDLLDSAQLCLDTLEEHLHEHQTLEAWTPPLFGVSVGVERLGAANSIEELVRMAMRSSASFSANQLKGVTFSDQFREWDSWEKQIEDVVTRRAPQLRHNFNQSFSVIEGISDTRFDYLGSNYIANFGKVAHHTSVSYAKAKLLNLLSLAEVRNVKFGEQCPNLELILLKSTSNGKADEKIFELSEVCRRHELRAIPVGNADEAGKHILSMEKVA